MFWLDPRVPSPEHFESDSASDGSVGSAAPQLRYNDGAEPSEMRGSTSLRLRKANASSPDFFSCCALTSSYRDTSTKIEPQTVCLELLWANRHWEKTRGETLAPDAGLLVSYWPLASFPELGSRLG